MIFDLNNQYEIPKYKEYVNKLYNEKAVVEVRKKMPHRSLPQNRYFYLLLGWFAAETGYSVDEVKLDIFKKLVNKDLFVVEAKNRRGGYRKDRKEFRKPVHGRNDIGDRKVQGLQRRRGRNLPSRTQRTRVPSVHTKGTGT